MKYEEFYNELTNLGEHIQTFKDENIVDSNLIMKFIKNVFKNINDSIKYHCIIHFNYVIKTSNFIKRIVETKTNEIILDEIIILLQNKQITPTDNLNIVYKDVLEFMINNDIINDIYNSNYNSNYDCNNDSDSETESELDKIPNIPIINQSDFKFRINQIEAFEKLEKYGLQKGILNSATGTGKSYIIIRYIDYVFRKLKNNCKIILFTERVNILKDLFELDNLDKLKEKILYWKQINVGDLTDIKIIERVINKTYNWVDCFKQKGPILLLINRAFLSNRKLYKQLTKDNISLVIHDECHNATSPKCFDIIKHFDNLNVPIIGLSATPIRTGNKQIEKLKSVYGINNKINLIINYGLIFAIEKELIVPPVFNWYYFDNFSDDNENEINDNDVNSILTCLNNKIDELPYRKIIAWCGYIELTKKWIEKIKVKINNYDKLKQIKFYADIDNYEYNNVGCYKDFRQITNDGILFCAKKHKEGSDILNLDSCIFLDKAKNRESIPFIQCIGRVLRNNTNKKFGYIFDGLQCNNYKYMIDKIIDYYQTIQNLTHISELSNNELNNRIDNISKAITYNKNSISLEIGTVKINIDTMNIILNSSNIKNLNDSLKQMKKITNCRNPLLCINHMEKIMHRIAQSDIWEFYYDKEQNGFIFKEKIYKTMNKLTELHYRTSLPNRVSSNNAWLECKIYRNNEWISMHDLPIIN